MNVELRHLRSFLVVADELNFTRAAQRLRISQPSLTRTMNSLERMVGARLLYRTTRHVSLTPEGERLRTDVDKVLHELDQVLMLKSDSAPLKLGFTWLLPDVWAQQAINLFEEQTRVRVEMIRRDEHLAGVDHGEVDIAVLRGNKAPSGLRTVTLFREHRVAAVRRGSALARQSRIRWDGLANCPLVVNVVSGTTQVEQWPAELRPTPAAWCENFDEWLEAVAAGRGIGVVPASAAYRVAHPAVRFLPIDRAPLVPVHLAYPRQGPHPFARQFVQAAQRVAIPPHAAPAE